MEEENLEIQADVAYGIFEIFLHKALRLRGPYLFDLVEKGIEFHEFFTTIFGEFEREYPELATTIKKGYGGTDTVYHMIQKGEGVFPTKTFQTFYIIQDAPDMGVSTVDDENVGKWLIFVDPPQADEAWKKVRDATCGGLLGISSKVSTAKPNPESRDQRMVIFVYTRDWRDEPDVMRVRNQLRELGFVDRIGYKRNIETYRGEYSKKGKRVTYYSA